MIELENTVINYVKTIDEVNQYKRWLGERRDWLAFDSETGGLEWWKQPLRLVQIGDADTAWVFRADRWLGVVEETLLAYEDRIVGQNIGFDWRFLKAQGNINISWANLFDTKIMAHLLDPAKSTSLKALGSRYLSPKAKKLQGTLEAAMTAQKWGWADIPFDYEFYWGYAGFDCILTARLAEDLYPQVQANYQNVFDMEMQVARICSNMEMRGARVNLEYCDQKYQEITEYCTAIEGWCLEQYNIRPSQTQQVAIKLVEEGVDLSKTTESGLWAMDKDVLEGIDHPLAQAVLEHRQKTKIGNTYFRNFLQMHDNGVLHPSINTLGARTARMTIQNPALQTLPRGTVVRDAFIPHPGEKLFSVDFAGIEARLFAHFAEEKEMIQVFHEGFDPHRYTAQQVFQVDEPTSQQRQIAKNATFALLYGAGPEKVGITAGITTEQAELFLTTYKTRFPGVDRFMKTVERVAKQRLTDEKVGYVKTPMGRKLVGEKDKLYALVNALIQGAACDVFKRALVDLDNAGFGEYMILPVHDEVIFSAPEDISINEIVSCMEDLRSFRVPLTCEASKPLDKWGDKTRG